MPGLLAKEQIRRAIVAAQKKPPIKVPVSAIHLPHPQMERRNGAANANIRGSRGNHGHRSNGATRNNQGNPNIRRNNNFQGSDESLENNDNLVNQDNLGNDRSQGIQANQNNTNMQGHPDIASNDTNNANSENNRNGAGNDDPDAMEQEQNSNNDGGEVERSRAWTGAREQRDLNAMNNARDMYNHEANGIASISRYGNRDFDGGMERSLNREGREVIRSQVRLRQQRARAMDQYIGHLHRRQRSELAPGHRGGGRPEAPRTGRDGAGEQQQQQSRRVMRTGREGDGFVGYADRVRSTVMFHRGDRVPEEILRRRIWVQRRLNMAAMEMMTLQASSRLENRMQVQRNERRRMGLDFVERLMQENGYLFWGVMDDAGRIVVVDGNDRLVKSVKRMGGEVDVMVLDLGMLFVEKFLEMIISTLVEMESWNGRTRRNAEIETWQMAPTVMTMNIGEVESRIEAERAQGMPQAQQVRQVQRG